MVFFSGHSLTDLLGRALLMKGSPVLPSDAPKVSQKWLVTSYADWNAIPRLRGWQDCLIVESIGGPGQTLANLALVLLAGCGLSTGVQTGGLSDWFLFKGAKTTITIGYIQVYSIAVCIFLDGYGGGNDPQVPGFMQLLKNNTVHDACLEARGMTQDWARGTYGGIILSPAEFDAKFQGDATLHIIP